MVAMRAMCNFYLNINNLLQCLLQCKALFADRPNPVGYAAAFGGDGSDSEEIKGCCLSVGRICEKTIQNKINSKNAVEASSKDFKSDTNNS